MTRFFALISSLVVFTVSPGSVLAADLCDEYTRQGYRSTGKTYGSKMVAIVMLNKEGTICQSPKASFVSPSRLPAEFPQLAKLKYFSCGGSLIAADLSGLIDKSKTVWIIQADRYPETTYRCKQYGSQKVARATTPTLYYTFDESKNTLKLFAYVTIEGFLLEKEALPNL